MDAKQMQALSSASYAGHLVQGIAMAFFLDNASKLAPLSLDGNAQYRECQIGAAWATLAHFTSSTEPALISMPTGSGKTALMMMLSFLLKAKRVIIVTPVVALRGQTHDKFESLADLREIGAVTKRCPNPTVHDHMGQLRKAKDWESFLQYDVVVATPHTTSPGYEDIVGPVPGTFGPETVLFFDEAHHSRARTWQVLMDTFAGSRVVLLTATPFRNDNRRLLARLVYHYPMRKALDSRIYAPITYHGIGPSDAKKKDEELCQTAIAVYKRQKKKHPKARLLIRAEGVKNSAELLELYREKKLKVEEVNYKKTLDDNRKALDGLRDGSLDGVVCIDQIGEGLDVPSLKIAVLHKPRQSFPATVQFVGRICREAKKDIGDPHLIACADDVRGPLQRLYLHDNAWRDFVPDLVEKVVGKMSRGAAFHGVVDVETELDLSPADIQPFFSARVYRKTNEEAFSFDVDLDLRQDVVPVFLDNITDKNMLVIVTGIEKTLPWAEEADLSVPHFDLHVFYWHASTEQLFEYTTSDKIAGMIRKSLWDEAFRRIDAAAVSKALQEATASQYLMFGLSNLARGSGSVPSYKTYMGREVEGAVRPTDSRSFTPGHALAKYSDGRTRGIGSNQARVWSIKRATLNEFTQWCDHVAKCLVKKGDSRLPNVEFLPSPESILAFPEKPLAAYVRWVPTVSVSIRTDGTQVTVGSISLDGVGLAPDQKAVTGTLTIGNGPAAEETPFIYTLGTPHWSFGRKDLPLLIVDDGNEIHSYGLADFLDANPPILVLGDGSTVIGNCRYRPAMSLPSLPIECLDDSWDWSECDIHVEFEYHDANDPKKSRIPAPGQMTVHDQVEKWLKTNAPPGTLVVKDHASGEIADFVAIQPKAKILQFYHCKGCAPGKKPGARISELNVLEQVLRSIDRIGTNSLLFELHERVTKADRPNTKMAKGTAQRLGAVATSFHANQWRFVVVVVNPGINCRKARNSKNTNTLLTTCYEWLATANAMLLVIGS